MTGAVIGGSDLSAVFKLGMSSVALFVVADAWNTPEIKSLSSS